MISLGMDVGSTSVEVAVMGDEDDRGLLEKIASESEHFFSLDGGSSSPLLKMNNPLSPFVKGELKGVVPLLRGKCILVSKYKRIKGMPVESSYQLLEELYRYIPEDEMRSMRVTGAGGQLISQLLDAPFENEFNAVAQGVGILYPDVRTIFEMGGDNSKYIRIEVDQDAGFAEIVDYDKNGECAAGTGSFMDQQASRLKYKIEEVGDIVLRAGKATNIAGRCSVFAKSDMIHAQQEGFQPPEILKGLCESVVRNFKSAIVQSRKPWPKVAFIGGVAANKGVVQSMRSLFGLNDGELFVPGYYAWMSAIGAALLAKNKMGKVPHTPGRRRNIKSIQALAEHSEARKQVFPTTRPLNMDRVTLLRDRVKPYSFDGRPDVVDAYLGVDVGSVSTNLAVIDDNGDLILEIYVPTESRPIDVVSRNLRKIGSEIGHRVRIRGVGTTGSGREMIGALMGADTINDEITAHKTGATHIADKFIGSRPDTIFEIGGQDSKFISIEDDVVVDFTMNEACAAGTGSFLEEQAEKLGINIKDEFAALALSFGRPIRLGERCTVFMEKDLNPYLQKGAEINGLVAGLAFSVATNYLNRVVRGRRIGDCIFFQGGTAYNDSVVAAFATVLDKEIIVPPHNGVIGAIGAALLAKEKMMASSNQPAADSTENQPAADSTENQPAADSMENQPAADSMENQPAADSTENQPAADSMENQPAADSTENQPAADSTENQPAAGSTEGKETSFRGYGLDKVDYKIRSFTCPGCSNRCDIQEVRVEDERTYWGDKCSERYRRRSKTDKKPVIPDLISFRQGLLLEGYEEDTRHKTQDARQEEGASGLKSGVLSLNVISQKIGIPRAMYTYDRFPFWNTFLSELGFDVVLSDTSNKKVINYGIDAVVAEPCFPIKLAHGHVMDLLEKGMDYIFIPNMLNVETEFMDVNSHVCPWGQTMTFVIRHAPMMEGRENMLLQPTVHFRDGKAAVTKELQAFIKDMSEHKGMGEHKVRPYSIRKKQVARAVDMAYRARMEFRQKLMEAGQKALRTLVEEDELGIVIVGRSYNIYDSGVNLDIPKKLRDYYGVNVIPMDFLPLKGVDISHVNSNMYWDYGRRILQAARIVAQYPNLHIIYITNFKCGPDSYIKHFVREASGGKPFLTLQFDGHSNDAGFMTRCEAYLDSKGFLRWWKRERV